MSPPLPRLLDDLAADIGPSDVSGDLASSAWAAGRRRRLRHRAVTIGAAVVVALLAVVLVLPVVGSGQTVVPSSSGGDDRVSGYPERIGHQWHIGGLPNPGEPMAALVQRDQNEGPDRWVAVSESGQQFRLPGGGSRGDVYPALSPDGRYVGYLAGDGGPYVLVDVVSGQDIRFADLGSVGSSTRYGARAQAPAFWSPDSTRLLVAANPRAGGRTSGLLLGLDGSVTPVRGDPTIVVGLTDESEVIRVNPSSERQLAATYSRVDGTTTRSSDLTVDAALTQEPGAILRASVSPDGTRLAVADDSAGTGTVVHVFALDSPADEARAVPVAAAAGSCPIAWVGDTAAMTTRDDGATSAVLVQNAPADPVSVVDPSLDARCLLWAAAALEGAPHDTLWGTSTAWWTWWWRELAAALLVLLGIGWVVARAHRRDAPPGGLPRLDLLSQWRR